MSAYLTKSKSQPLRSRECPLSSLPLSVNFLTSTLTRFSLGCYFMNAMLLVGLATLSLWYYMETWYNISGACVKLIVIYPYQDSLMETSWWTVICCLQCYICDDLWRFSGNFLSFLTLTKCTEYSSGCQGNRDKTSTFPCVIRVLVRGWCFVWQKTWLMVLASGSWHHSSLKSCPVIYIASRMLAAHRLWLRSL